MQNTTCNATSFIHNTSVTDNTTYCCDDCLGMTPEQYNLLYAIYAWTYVITKILLNSLFIFFICSIIVGFLNDRLRDRVILCSLVIRLGSNIRQT